VRVQEILRDRYADQLLPVSSGELNRLTVFLSEDGKVEREDMEHSRLEDMRSMRADDSTDVARMAQGISSKLALDIERIGLIGATALQEGAMKVVRDENGNTHADDQRRMLLVYYAWPRRAGETAPTMTQMGTAAQAPRIDLAAALAIVEHHIPDAFTLTDRSAGEPTVVLTTKGEVIRAGRVKPRSGESMDKLLQEQLVPGVRTSSYRSQRLTNADGAKAEVNFAWEMPEQMKQASAK
jgi:hypothetical protein